MVTNSIGNIKKKTPKELHEPWTFKISGQKLN
jgi:hypothetical protein